MFNKITNIMSYVIVVMGAIILICGMIFLVKIGLAGGTGAFLILGLLIMAFAVYGTAFYIRYKRFQNMKNEEESEIEENSID